MQPNIVTPPPFPTPYIAHLVPTYFSSTLPSRSTPSHPTLNHLNASTETVPSTLATIGLVETSPRMTEWANQRDKQFFPFGILGLDPESHEQNWKYTYFRRLSPSFIFIISTSFCFAQSWYCISHFCLFCNVINALYRREPSFSIDPSTFFFSLFQCYVLRCRVNFFCYRTSFFFSPFSLRICCQFCLLFCLLDKLDCFLIVPLQNCRA